ncbi:MAG: glycosyltransferase family 2 protein [Campylobacterota bacterium]
MMAKNVEAYIPDAIKELQKETKVPWELVIVEDHSDDATFEVASRFAAEDTRVRVVKNKYNGKVMGTNYGYSLTRGDIIKCIDSDDVLSRDFFDCYEEMQQYDAHCHDALIVDNALHPLAHYHINREIIERSYSEVMSNLISIPKAYWSFKRQIAQEVFPLPQDLPFEDVWISLLVKKNARSIKHIQKYLYHYRQHTTQVFGGVLSGEFKTVQFRAQRLVKLIEIFETSQKKLQTQEVDFSNMKTYLNLIVGQASVFTIISSHISIKQKVKALLQIHFPFLMPLSIRLKWKLNQLKWGEKV